MSLQELAREATSLKTAGKTCLAQGELTDGVFQLDLSPFSRTLSHTPSVCYPLSYPAPGYRSFRPRSNRKRDIRDVLLDQLGESGVPMGG